MNFHLSEFETLKFCLVFEDQCSHASVIKSSDNKPTSKSVLYLMKCLVAGKLTRWSIVETSDSLIRGYWWQSRILRNSTPIPPHCATRSGFS